MTTAHARKAVIVRIGGRQLALPVERVVEVMRPLPLEPAAAGAGASVVLGAARIRGTSCRVIDTARVLGVADAGATRFVVVCGAGARVALQVEAVLDVREVTGGAGPDLAAGLPDDLGPTLRAVLGGACWIDAARIEPIRPAALQTEPLTADSLTAEIMAMDTCEVDAMRAGASQVDAPGAGASQVDAPGAGASQVDAPGAGASQVDAPGAGASQVDAPGAGASQAEARPAGARGGG